MLIMDTELPSPIVNVLDEVLEMGYTIYSYGGPQQHDFATPLDLTLISDAALPRSLRRKTTANDLAMLIYTSGTTGLPKAGRFSHSRANGKNVLFFLSGIGTPLPVLRECTYRLPFVFVTNSGRPVLDFLLSL